MLILAFFGRCELEVMCHFLLRRFVSDLFDPLLKNPQFITGYDFWEKFLVIFNPFSVAFSLKCEIFWNNFCWQFSKSQFVIQNLMNSCVIQIHSSEIKKTIIRWFNLERFLMRLIFSSFLDVELRYARLPDRGTVSIDVRLYEHSLNHQKICAID